MGLLHLVKIRYAVHVFLSVRICVTITDILVLFLQLRAEPQCDAKYAAAASHQSSACFILHGRMLSDCIPESIDVQQLVPIHKAEHLTLRTSTALKKRHMEQLKTYSLQPRIPVKNVQGKVDTDIIKSGNSDVLVIPVHVYT